MYEQTTGTLQRYKPLHDALRILRAKQVVEKTSLSQSEIYERVKEGEFPQQIRLGGNRVGWIESEIDAWIAERIAESRDRVAV